MENLNERCLAKTLLKDIAENRLKRQKTARYHQGKDIIHIMQDISKGQVLGNSLSMMTGSSASLTKAASNDI